MELEVVIRKKEGKKKKVVLYRKLGGTEPG